MGALDTTTRSTDMHATERAVVWRRLPYARRPELVPMSKTRAVDEADAFREHAIEVPADGTVVELVAEELTPAHATQVLVDVCHGASMKAGWWINPKTGVDARGNPMCFAQKLCLIHSEISEAMEGDRKSLKDDKLPHRDMREVELADALIRICDLAGAYGMDLGGAVAEKLAFNAVRPDHKAEIRAAAGGKAY
ncbi:hypothetical protein D3C72_1051560 [compost metagenome]